MRKKPCASNYSAPLCPFCSAYPATFKRRIELKTYQYGIEDVEIEVPKISCNFCRTEWTQGGFDFAKEILNTYHGRE